MAFVRRLIGAGFAFAAALLLINAVRVELVELVQETREQQNRHLEAVAPAHPERAYLTDLHPVHRQLQDHRVACFGGTDTWSAVKFDNPIDIKYSAMSLDYENSYCSQLGPNVDNYGFASQGPNYASSCLQSMLGEKEYDIIVVDFPLASPEDISNLVERLRMRFPGGMILSVNRFLLKKVKVINPTRPLQQQMIERWLHYNAKAGRKIEWGDPWSTRHMDKNMLRAAVEVKKAVRVEMQPKYDAVLADPKHNRQRPATYDKWIFSYRNSHKSNEAKLAKQYKTISVNFGDEDDIEGSMLSTLDLYHVDGVTMNPDGHDFLAGLIKDKIYEQKNFKPTQKLGSFGDGDSCKVFFTRPNDVTAASIKRGNGVVLNNYVDIRYGMEFDSGADSWIEVENPFDTPRALYISYIVHPTTPKVFQSADIEIPDQGINVHVDTVASLAYQEKTSQTTPRTIPIGVLPPGKHTMYIKSHHRTGILPFRLVGVSFTDGWHTPHEWDFTQKFWWKGFTERLYSKDVVWV